METSEEKTGIDHVEVSDCDERDSSTSPDDYQALKLEDVLPKHSKLWIFTPHLLKLNLLLAFCMMSSTTYGYDGSMMNGLISMTTWKAKFHDPQGQHLGGLNNGMLFGGIAAWPLQPFVADRFGRKVPIAIGCAMIVLGSIVQGTSNIYAIFLLGRLFVGFGSVFCQNSSPLLLSEVTYPTHRFIVTGFYNTWWYAGATIAAGITLGTSKLASNWAWRIPSLCQGVLPLIQLFIVYFVPESPRYYIAKGQPDKAREMLVRHHAGGDTESKLVDFEMAEITATVERERLDKESSYFDFFRGKANRHRLFLLVMIPINMQLSGNGLVSYYLTLVLDSIGITAQHTQLLINLCLMIYNWVFAVSFVLLVERAGRRPLFLFSLLGMLICYIVWTALSAVNQERDFKDAGFGKGVLGMVFLYYFFYGSALTGMPYLYWTEILPYQLRAKGLNIAMMTTTCVMIFNNFVNPIAMEKIQWRYYILYCCIIVVELVIAYFCYPETKGHTLETVGSVFGEEIVQVNKGNNVEIVGGDEKEKTKV